MPANGDGQFAMQGLQTGEVRCQQPVAADVYARNTQ
jgi:hypothetical protein